MCCDAVLPGAWCRARVSMDPITTANPLGDDGPELGITVHHYMNTGEGMCGEG